MLPTERMLNRRGVLGAGAALAAALCCRPWPMLRRAIAEPTPASGPPRHMALGTWQVIAAVQELLLPPDDLGPGASDVNAIGYLDAVLGEPGLEPEVAPRLKSGAERLDRLCRQHHRRPFVGLDVALRERALLELDGQPEGRAWITELLGFLLEALLGDPARGANPDELGWKWLGYEPPLPRPPHPGWQPRESS